MTRKWTGKAIGARSARKLIREIGGITPRDLIAEHERVVAALAVGIDEIVQLSDGRILFISGGSAVMYPSARDYLETLAGISESRARSLEHPLGRTFGDGTMFIEAVPSLLQQLPEKLRVPAAFLDGSIDGLERLDRAAQRLGGSACLDDPSILAPLVAYVGEVIRNATGGDWTIRVTPGQPWQPVIVDADGVVYSTFGIFKELLERGSMRAVVEHEVRPAGNRTTRAGHYANRETPIAPPIGLFAGAPADSYEVTKRYGDGRPWFVTFHRDVEVAGFPFKAHAEGWVKRDGDIIGGTLSRATSFAGIEFPEGSHVRFYKGLRDGRVYDAKLGADHVVLGVPCKAGTFVHFRIHKGKPYVSGATLAADYEVKDVIYPSGNLITFDRQGFVASSYPADRYQ